MERFFGTTGKFLQACAEGDRKPFKVFFKPYKDTSEFFTRAAAIITAPVLYAGFCVGTFVFALYNLFKSLYELIKGALTGNWKAGVKAAKGSAGSAGHLFLTVLTTAVATFTSAPTELVDVIGGGIKSIPKKKNDKEVIVSDQELLRPSAGLSR